MVCRDYYFNIVVRSYLREDLAVGEKFQSVTMTAEAFNDRHARLTRASLLVGERADSKFQFD